MSEPFIGEILIFAGNFAPRGWATCEGQLLPINQNDALFALLGTTYGGDGRTTFGLPDLRGRVPLHRDQGVGLTFRRLGDEGGSENEVLNATTTPTHDHDLNAVNTAASQKSPAGAVIADKTRGDMYYADFNGASLTTVPMNSAAIGSAGASSGHPNMASSLVLRYCIALVGVFPSRN